MEFGRTTANVPLGPFLGGMVPPMTSPSMFPQVQGIWAFGVQEEGGCLGSCALTVLGLAKGVTPVVSVTGKRVREHAGLRVPCGGLRLPLWLRGLVWYLGGGFIPTGWC